MRSGSSLLVHILNSNDEIIGFGEAHHEYQSSSDLDWLVVDQMRFWRRFKLPERYVMDKIVHDKYGVSDSLLKSNDIKKLFLIREPQRGLSSILMAAKAQGLTDWTEQMAADYYRTRLASLERYAEIIGNKEGAFFLTHDQLINDSTRTLAAVGSWLNLKEPLGERYKVHKATGRWGVGDGSDNIKIGRIIKPESEVIEISPGLLAEASLAYEQCYKTLSGLCSTVDEITVAAVTDSTKEVAR